ncbi:hypothetical protein TNCV_1368941 [Trichonephila clavipes]|nr:hypothetical protein TNCV_1368941 [Trichonephila clavipes]
MFSLVFLQSPSQVKLTMTVLLRHNRLIRSVTPNSIWNFLGTQKNLPQRFDHVHLDLIGPLPPSNGHTYCLTMIDRFRNGQRPNLSKDITAETVAEAFFFLLGVSLWNSCNSHNRQGRQFSPRSSKCKPAFFLNTENLQLPQTKKETPVTVEPNATASTPATVESDQQLQRLPSHLHVLVAKFIFQLGIVDTGRGVCSDLTAQQNDSKTELN